MTTPQQRYDLFSLFIDLPLDSYSFDLLGSFES